MFLPLSALNDPVFEYRDFAIGQLQTGINGGHAIGFDRRSNALDHLAGGGVTFDNGSTATEIGLGGSLRIQAQRDFFRDCVGAVATVALVGKDRADVAIEFDGPAGSEGGQREDE